MGISANAIACSGQSVTLDASDMCVAGDPLAVLETKRLGSCVAVLIHDPKTCTGGAVRYVLPDSSVNPQRARQRPSMFADTALPLLVDSLLSLGCRKEDLVVKAVGAGGVDGGGVFDIGRRNAEALEQACAMLGLTISARRLGGRASRSATLRIGSGQVTVKARARRRSCDPQGPTAEPYERATHHAGVLLPPLNHSS